MAKTTAQRSQLHGSLRKMMPDGISMCPVKPLHFVAKSEPWQVDPGRLTEGQIILIFAGPCKDVVLNTEWGQKALDFTKGVVLSMT